jgi:superfamily II DNA helicase RecQ
MWITHAFDSNYLELWETNQANPNHASHEWFSWVTPKDSDSWTALVVVGPELLMDRWFWKLWEQPSFRQSVSRIILDETHCVDEWGDEFRPTYLDLSRLYAFLMHSGDIIQWFLTSATLDIHMLSQILQVIGMKPFDTEPHERHTLWLPRSNDRPNHFIVVHQMKEAKSSYRDLLCVVPKNLMKADPCPPSFAIYCDIQQSVTTLRHEIMPSTLGA